MSLYELINLRCLLVLPDNQPTTTLKLQILLATKSTLRIIDDFNDSKFFLLQTIFKVYSYFIIRFHIPVNKALYKQIDKNENKWSFRIWSRLPKKGWWSLKTAYETGETLYNFMLVTKRFKSPKTIMRYAGTRQNYQSRQNSQTFYLDKRKITRIQAIPRWLLPTSATTIHQTSSFGNITIYGKFLFCIHMNSQYIWCTYAF